MERPVAYSGTRLRVVFAVCTDGSSPAKGFFEQLAQSDQAKLLAMFRMLGETGQLRNREKFKKILGPLFEFKSFQIRMPCFFDGSAVVITHGFVKKQNSIPNSEIEKAERIKQEDLARKKAQEGRK